MSNDLDNSLNSFEATKLRKFFRPESYDQFINRLYKSIDRIVQMLEDSSSLQQTSGEDLLTVQIVAGLKMAEYNASHDNYTSGHVDIRVEHKEYIWLGEAKIHNEYDWLFKGITQLMNRYSKGRPNQSHMGIIIYIFGLNAKNVMIKWKQHLQEKSQLAEFKNELGYQSIDCKIESSLYFTSEHTHPTSGSNVYIKHFPVLLHHKPSDTKV
ncbi:MAG: hypothetical protein HYZ42_15015 [Bacteroidetes bacterium]|nr:hypothetical protein [Bacteroidota bacterium]